MANAVNRYFEGFIVGGALGFVAGLLTAPKPGSELRKQLIGSYEDAMEQANEQIGELKENLSERVQPIKEKASERISQVSEKMQGGKELVNNYMGNNSGPMYTPGAKASPQQSGATMGDISGAGS